MKQEELDETPERPPPPTDPYSLTIGNSLENDYQLTDLDSDHDTDDNNEERGRPRARSRCSGNHSPNRNCSRCPPPQRDRSRSRSRSRRSKMRFKTSFQCKDGCHTYHRLESKEKRLFSKLFTHTTQPDSAIKTLSRPKEKWLNYPTMVDMILNRSFFKKVIAGTNQHGADDDKYDPIPVNTRGIHIIKMYLCILLANGFRNQRLQNIWSQDLKKGAPFVSIFLSRKKFFSINRHLCFNRWDPDHTHPYRKFVKGHNQLWRQSRILMQQGHIFALDEIRVTSTSKRDKFKTKMDKKPKVLARDMHSVCTATQKFHGYLLTTLPSCGDKTYSKTNAIVDDEKKMDNIVNQLIRANKKCDYEIYVMDRRYSSIPIATKISKALGGIGMVGCIDQRRTCLPKCFWAEGSETAAEIKRMKRGDFIQLRDHRNKTNITLWMDSKLVTLIDNCINPFARGTVKRKVKENGVTTVKTYRLPYVCRFYNLFMGECDAASAHRKNFEIDVKTFRHNNRTFLSILEFFALINPALIYGDNHPGNPAAKCPKVPHEDLRRQLIEKWSKDCEEWRKENGLWLNKPKPISSKSRINSTNTLIGTRPKVHQQIKYNPKKYHTSQQVQCNICKKKTTYVCSTCHPQVGLCAKTRTTGHRNCFVEFHNRDFPDHTAVPHTGIR